jgi:hypothetical protein
MRDRRTTVWLLALALPLLAAGCGNDGPPPAAPTPTEALWNPCDALDAKDVNREFGTSATENPGTPTSPSCSFAPQTEGDPVVDANYVLFPEGLDAAWETMGRSETAQVTSPKVRGADDTRLVVDADAEQLYVSGFVQNAARMPPGQCSRLPRRGCARSLMTTSVPVRPARRSTS